MMKDLIIGFFLLGVVFCQGEGSLKFTTNKWITPGTFPGAPPVKFAGTGDTIVISCKVNDPTANAKLLVSSIGSEVYMSAVKKDLGRVSVESQIFTISKITASDEGKYKCVAQKSGTTIELFKGALIVKAPEIRQIVPVLSNIPHPTNLKIDRGGEIVINCSVPLVAKTERSYLKWYKSTIDGDIAIDESRIKAIRVMKEGKEVDMSMMSIRGFQEKDIGRYLCKNEIPNGYTTFTEIWFFMKGFCYFDNNLQPIKTRFVSQDCTGSCTCDDSNSKACVSLCPPHYVICPPGQIEVALPENVSKSPDCSCKRKQCVNETGHCYFEDNLYRKGETFTSKKCASCKCVGFNTVQCVSLCQSIKVKCAHNEMEHYEVQEPSEGCYCKKPVCLNISDVCQLKPEPGPCFALFRRWHYNGTSQRCEKFDFGGCQGNPNRFVKKDVCEDTCNPDKRMKTKLIKKITPGDCKYDDKWYRSGENFISMDCKSNCTCQKDGSATCLMLCPPPIAPTACREDEMLVLKPREVSQTPSCFCEEGTCLKREKVCKLKPEAGSCYAAYRRWYYSPISLTCEKFIYGGCEGNPNNFLTVDECESACIGNDVPPQPGPSYTSAPKVVKISGKIKLSPGVATLPTPSCASIKMIEKNDKSIEDEEDQEDENDNKKPQTSTSSFSISDIDISRGIDYQLLTPSDEDPVRKRYYSLSAVVNVGWCRDQYSAQWIRDDDYVTKETYDVVIDQNNDAYNVDIDVKPM